MFDRWFKKETPLLGMLGMGGGVGSNLVAGGSTPITASGGTESTPGDGYKYHVYEYNSPGPFNVTDGAGEVQIMLQGGGGGGQGGGGFGGNPGPSFWPGRGGGGGATGVFTIANLGPGDHTISVGGGGPGGGGVSGGSPGSDGFGGSGGDTTFTLSDSSGVLTSGGAPGSSGSSNSSTVPGATITVNRGGGGGGTQSPNPRRPGGTGASAGGIPEPTSLWWRPYISPGAGGTGSNLPFDTGTQTPATPGSNYGGGGGGGRGGFPGPSGFNSATPAAAGAQGRAVVRYLVP